MDGLLGGLNEAQREAVTSEATVVQVLAPPGSGKTKTLTARVAYLISHRGLQPWNIITCTFTKKAANEMKERVRNLIGDLQARQIKLGTFHSIAGQYLRQYGQHIGLSKDFGIADTSDSKAIIKRIIKKNDLSIEPGQALGRISGSKCRGIDSEHFAQTVKNVEQQECALVFSEYEAELKASNLLDYDDLLLRCCFLMRCHPQCVSNVEAVLIDEFQDTNTVQYDLMSLFAQKCNVITIVGDPDQSIYGFRNAEIKNLTLMKLHWPETLTIHLAENYRSSGAILNAAQKLIEQDVNRPQKKLQATHSHGERPVLRKLPTAAGEASWLVSEIKRTHTLSAGLLQYSDFAILLRSAALSRVIEAALGREGIPYRMVGGLKFFDRVEVKLIVDYLRVIDQPSNSEAVERIINVPSRRIGDATVKSLREEASKKGLPLWTFICDVAQGKCRATTKLPSATAKGLDSFVNIILSGRTKASGANGEQVSLVGLINLVIKKANLQSYLKTKYENDYEAKWANVEELMAQAADASDPARLQAMMEENALPPVDGLDQREPTTDDALSLFLANIALTASVEKQLEDGSEPVHQLIISTIHSAKGLEWPVVFIPACYEGSIPHSRADDHDEERRLLYVGMTRAQAILYLSCPIMDTQRQETTMSPFLTQPGLSQYFEEHGPSIAVSSVRGLATTLRREEPSITTFQAAKRSLLNRDEDDYWPLHGEEPQGERARWEHGTADNALPAFGTMRPATWVTGSTSMGMHQQQPQGFTLGSASRGRGGFSMSSASTDQGGLALNSAPTAQGGFVSLKDRYEEIVEQGRLAAVDKRAEAEKKKREGDAFKGRKRTQEGQGSLDGFFAKKRTNQNRAVDTRAILHAAEGRRASQTDALRDISNQISQPPLTFTNAQSSKAVPPSFHRPRTAPLRQPVTNARPHSPLDLPSAKDQYVFLSSSPQRPQNAEDDMPRANALGTEGSRASPVDLRGDDPPTRVQPASTFHTTSLDMLRQQRGHGTALRGRGRRLGVKPSFDGWANRARK